MRLIFLGLLFVLCINGGLAEPIVYSARLVHRFSEEAKAHQGVRVLENGGEVGGGGVGFWPQRRSLEYYRRLLSSDVQRQTLKLNPQFQFLYPSEGSATLPLGNDFGWLHYMWIDIGTPKVSFLVALDAGSDLFWVPCDCVQCAPLSSSYYSSLAQIVRILSSNVHIQSITIRMIPQPLDFWLKRFCILCQAILYPTNLCGSKQTGGYLNGVAPDGLLGLGLGEISVPSFLAKAGYIRNSFSLCFSEDDSGRLFFGDQGVANQQTTPFLPLDGKNLTYIIGVDACCIGSSCLDHTNFEMLVDSGSSFTFLPDQIYERVVDEFDRQINASKSSFEGYPWQYCYKSSSQGVPKIPSLTLKFATSNSFVVNDPVFVIYGTQGAVGFCLAIQPTDQTIGTIGQNFMTGYQIVFDRESFKLGWSRSNCQDLDYGDRVPLNSSGNSNSPNSLPTAEQQSAPNGNAVPPAVAGRTPSKSSTTRLSYSAKFFLLLLIAHLSS
ncbi:UNVERIFIED_CONTAM: Aspartic proteinase-like protein 1 [Sesamum latifolium]|uniref:Aspartic proteinase-like protein 1 n=1 Tax=Sesamum latifolium TaxID=2727402 RepID=A0AAW2X717_9LAMI